MFKRSIDRGVDSAIGGMLQFAETTASFIGPQDEHGHEKFTVPEFLVSAFEGRSDQRVKEAGGDVGLEKTWGTETERIQNLVERLNIASGIVNPAEVQGLQDVLDQPTFMGKVKRGGLMAVEGLGENVPQLGALVGGAMIGKAVGVPLLGAAAVGLPLNVGETRSKQLAAGIDSPSRALTFGALKSSLDAILPGRMAAKVFAQPVKALPFARGLGAITEKYGSKVVFRVATEAAGGAITEAITEGLQEFIDEVGILGMNVFAEENRERIVMDVLEAGIKSTLAGGVMGGVGGVRKPKTQQEQIDDIMARIRKTARKHPKYKSEMEAQAAEAQEFDMRIEEMVAGADEAVRVAVQADLEAPTMPVEGVQGEGDTVAPVDSASAPTGPVVDPNLAYEFTQSEDVGVKAWIEAEAVRLKAAEEQVGAPIDLDQFQYLEYYGHRLAKGRWEKQNKLPVWDEFIRTEAELLARKKWAESVPRRARKRMAAAAQKRQAQEASAKKAETSVEGLWELYVSWTGEKITLEDWLEQGKTLKGNKLQRQKMEDARAVGRSDAIGYGGLGQGYKNSYSEALQKGALNLLQAHWKVALKEDLVGKKNWLVVDDDRAKAIMEQATRNAVALRQKAEADVEAATMPVEGVQGESEAPDLASMARFKKRTKQAKPEKAEAREATAPEPSQATLTEAQPQETRMTAEEEAAMRADLQKKGLRELRDIAKAEGTVGRRRGGDNSKEAVIARIVAHRKDVAAQQPNRRGEKGETTLEQKVDFANESGVSQVEGAVGKLARLRQGLLERGWTQEAVDKVGLALPDKNDADARFTQYLCKRMGLTVLWVKGIGEKASGMVDRKDGTIIMEVRQNNKSPRYMAVMWHEVTELLAADNTAEGAFLWKELTVVAQRLVEKAQPESKAYLLQLIEKYEADSADAGFSGENAKNQAMREMVANILADRGMDTKFWETLAVENPKVFRVMIDKVRKWIASAIATVRDYMRPEGHPGEYGHLYQMAKRAAGPDKWNQVREQLEAYDKQMARIMANYVNLRETGRLHDTVNYKARSGYAETVRGEMEAAEQKKGGERLSFAPDSDEAMADKKAEQALKAKNKVGQFVRIGEGELKGRVGQVITNTGSQGVVVAVDGKAVLVDPRATKMVKKTADQEVAAGMMRALRGDEGHVKERGKQKWQGYMEGLVRVGLQHLGMEKPSESMKAALLEAASVQDAREAKVDREVKSAIAEQVEETERVAKLRETGLVKSEGPDLAGMAVVRQNTATQNSNLGPEAETVRQASSAGKKKGPATGKGWMHNFIVHAGDDRYALQWLEQTLYGGLYKDMSKSMTVQVKGAQSSAAGMAKAFIKYGMKDQHGVPISVSFENILKKVSGALPDFSANLVARRIVEVYGEDQAKLQEWRKGGEKGDAPKARDLGIDYLTASRAVEVFAEKYPNFKEAEGDLYKMQDVLLQYLVDAGVMGENTAKLFRKMYQSYVPLYRLMQDGPDGLEGMPQRYVDLVSPIKDLEGGTRTIIDPLESILKNIYWFTNIGERVKVGNLLNTYFDSPENQEMGLIERILGPQRNVKIGVDEVIEKLNAIGMDVKKNAEGKKVAADMLTFMVPDALTPRPGIVSVLDNGRRVFYKVDHDVWGALEGLGKETLPKILKILVGPAKMLRAGVVLSPDFFLGRNTARDVVQAFQYTSSDSLVNNYVPLALTIKGLMNMVFKPDVVQRYFESGADIGFVTQDRNSRTETLKQLSRQGPDFFATIKHPFEALRILSGWMETATRMGEYDSVYQEARKAGKSDAEARKMAMLAARNVTQDFDRLGKSVRPINQIAAFFGAGMGEYFRMAEQITHGKGMQHHGEYVKNTMKVMAKGMMTISLPTVLMYLLFNKDDPRYEELPQWQRDLFWTMTTGTVSKEEWARMSPKEKTEYQKKNPIIRIPKPFGPGMLFGSLVERIVHGIYTGNPGVVVKDMEAIIGAQIPNPVPTAAAVVFGQATNRDWRGLKIVPDKEKDLPVEMQVSPYEREVTKILAKSLGVSPRRLTHVIRGVTGGLGQQVLDVAESVGRGTGLLTGPALPERQAGDIPVLSSLARAFLVPMPSSSMSSIQEFYAVLDDGRKAKMTMDKYKELGDRGKAQEHYERNREALYSHNRLMAVAKRMSVLRTRQERIVRHPEMDKKEKAAKINEVQWAIAAMAGAALPRDPVVESIVAKAFNLLFNSRKEVVTEVLDGDTVKVVRKGKAISIRLNGIDAPESDQAFGKESTEYVTQRVLGMKVKVKDRGRDPYNRPLVDIYIEGGHVNEELLKHGLAWWYERYSPENKRFQQVEAEARAAKKGLWAGKNPVPPWDFRRAKKRKSTADLISNLRRQKPKATNQGAASSN